MKIINDAYLCPARDPAILTPQANKIDYSIIAQVNTDDNSEQYIM